MISFEGSKKAVVLTAQVERGGTIARTYLLITVEKLCQLQPGRPIEGVQVNAFHEGRHCGSPLSKLGQDERAPAAIGIDELEEKFLDRKSSNNAIFRVQVEQKGVFLCIGAFEFC